MKHYTKEELELYVNHEMIVLARIQCATHLKDCKECASLLAELERENNFIRELRESMQLYEKINASNSYHTHSTTPTP